MQFEKIQDQIEKEIENKKTYDKVIDRIALQLKATKKAEAIYNKEKAKLENLIEEKNKLSNINQQDKPNE